jgi:hypothetical protein
MRRERTITQAHEFDFETFPREQSVLEGNVRRGLATRTAVTNPDLRAFGRRGRGGSRDHRHSGCRGGKEAATGEPLKHRPLLILANTIYLFTNSANTLSSELRRVDL